VAHWIALSALPAVALGVIYAPAISAQSAAKPQFEVATVKACKVDHDNGPRSPGRLNTSCLSVVGLIQIAYEVYAGGRFNPMDFRDYPPIEGGPRWVYSDHYEISAKADGEASQAMMKGPLLEALLEDRFKLRMRREIREIPVYELTVAKGHPKLQPHKEGSCTTFDFVDRPAPPAPGELPPFLCGTIKGRRSGPNQIMDAYGMSLSEFCKFGKGLFGRPVIDKTGLTGKFDLHLEFDPTALEAREPGATIDDTSGPSIFTAMQEQLGLKLEAAKGPGEFLVIDHVERPSEN
jgi:uncharacterized protein (TIGR03435 family)